MWLVTTATSPHQKSLLDPETSRHPALTCKLKSVDEAQLCCTTLLNVVHIQEIYSQCSHCEQSQCQPLQTQASHARCPFPLKNPPTIHILTPTTEQSPSLSPPPVWPPQPSGLCKSTKNFRPSFGAPSLPSPRVRGCMERPC